MKKIILIILILSLTGCAKPESTEIKPPVLESSHLSELSEYGLYLNLPEAWADAKVFTSGQTPNSPLESLMKDLDNDYYRLIIRHPDWSESTPYQDIIFNVFNIEVWNENASNATGGDIHLLPQIIGIGEKHLSLVDPYNYNEDLSRYDEVIDILINSAVMEKDLNDYRVLDIIQIETENVMYKEGSNELKVLWHSILDDGLQTTGNYYIEKADGENWEPIYQNGGSQNFVYEIFSDDTSLFTYTLDTSNPLESQGGYRIGIDYKRKSIYGISLKENVSPTYRVYDDFYVGEEDIAKENISNNEENTIEGIDMQSEFSVYEDECEEVKVKIYNYLDDPFTYGASFVVEELIDSQWKPLRSEGDIAFESIGYILEAQSERWMTYNFSWIYGALDKGQYRIHTDILRDSIDGKDFGPGNYPSYDIYAYFEVGEQNVAKVLESFHNDKYEYKNAEYGFGMLLPKDWQGLTVSNEGQDANSPMHDLLFDLDPKYSIIRFQHPLKDSKNYQDIVFARINRDTWNKNAEQAVQGDWDLLPERFGAMNDLLIVDPYQYDKSLSGYKDIMNVFEEGIISY